eukprot:COSAG01_NODE_4956_length_4590_cov_7.535070_7_plen_69_part_00
MRWQMRTLSRRAHPNILQALGLGTGAASAGGGGLGSGGAEWAAGRCDAPICADSHYCSSSGVCTAVRV